MFTVVVLASPLRHHLSRLASFLSQRVDQAHAQTPPTNLQAIPTKLMVVIYDPILENYGGVRLHEYFPGWNDPAVLTNQLVNDFRLFTHDLVDYIIVEQVVRDEWPLHTNGQRYTDEVFVNGWNTGTLPDYGPGDYNAIINDNGIEQKVNDGRVDEVWLWGFPATGWWESAMAGSGAYWVNGGPISGINSKAFVLMGFNYERGMAEAAESYGHRTETIMNRVYGYTWNYTYVLNIGFVANGPIVTDLDRFTALDRDFPNLGGVGFAHNAFNTGPGEGDYVTTSTRFASTSEQDWYNFPAMTGARQSENCDSWGCTGYGWFQWWYDHMPHVTGSKDGRLNNWWRYIVDVDQYKNKGQFPAEVEETDMTELNTLEWECWAEGATCDLDDETINKKRGYAALDFTTDGALDTYIRHPRGGGANWNVSNKRYLSFWAYATNPSPNDFQNNSPWIFLKNDDGSYFKYQTNSDVMNQALDQWHRFTIPLTGDATWARTDSGSPTLTDIDQLEIHNDTWDTGFTILFDEVGFVGDLTENNASEWSCWALEATCDLTDETVIVERGQTSLGFSTTAAFDSLVAYPAAGGANWDLRNYNYLTFWAYAINLNPSGFQNSSPWIYLKNDNGSYFKYQTTGELMNDARGVWKQFQIPLRGDETWTRTLSPSGNPTFADIDQIEIHNDTWDSGFTILFDEVGFVKAGKPPQVSISSPAQGTIIDGIVPVTVAATDASGIMRTDLYIDGSFHASDSLTPYIFGWDTTGASDGAHEFLSRAYDSVGNETTSAPVTVYKNPPTQTLTFSPPHDTYVKSDVPNNKFGTATTLRVRKTSSVTFNSYLKFDVSGITGTVQSAKVRLYVTDTSPSGGSLYSVSNNYIGTSTPWIETGLTWNNAPTISGTPLSSVGNAPLNTWVEFDATPAITGNGTFSFGINSTNSNAVYYRSTEATSNRPELVVVATSIIAPSPTPSPSSSPSPSPVPSTVPSPTPSAAPTPTPSGSPAPSPTDVIFSDGFESGNTSAWSSETDAENDLNVTATGALVGTRGLAALIDNITSMYVTDTRPVAEPRYHARFYFDPNSVGMASADVHNIFVSRLSGGTAFTIQLNNNTGTTSGYRIRTQIYNKAASNTNGTYFVISDGPHFIEIDWKAADLGTNNGFITIWIDGVLKESVSGVDNDTHRIEEVRLGAVAGIDLGTNGTIYFDAFESRRNSNIGP